MVNHCEFIVRVSNSQRLKLDIGYPLLANLYESSIYRVLNLLPIQYKETNMIGVI